MFSLFYHENIRCGNSLEASRRDASNEYYSVCFRGEIGNKFFLDICCSHIETNKIFLCQVQLELQKILNMTLEGKEQTHILKRA